MEVAAIETVGEPLRLAQPAAQGRLEGAVGPVGTAARRTAAAKRCWRPRTVGSASSRRSGSLAPRAEQAIARLQNGLDAHPGAQELELPPEVAFRAFAARCDQLTGAIAQALLESSAHEEQHELDRRVGHEDARGCIEQPGLQDVRLPRQAIALEVRLAERQLVMEVQVDEAAGLGSKPM